MEMKFVVNLEVPEGVTPGMAAAYIRDAVRSWSGGMDPEHPLMGKTHRATVQRYKEPTRPLQPGCI